MELQGAKDHWVKNMNDPEDKRWEYTYHQRLAAWGTWKESNKIVSITRPVNQFKAMVEKLIEAPYTRRAQAVTWMPFMDNKVYDPPCLQSIWCRLTEEPNSTLALNTNIRFRSNDAWGAAFMNMFGLTMLIRSEIANPVEEGLGKPVKLGRINWQADSYHVYGKDIKALVQRVINNFKPLTEKVYYFYSPEVQEIWKEASSKIKDKIRKYDEEHC
jgi:thymidylate synthase